MCAQVVVTDLLKGKCIDGSYVKISAFCEGFMVIFFSFNKTFFIHLKFGIFSDP